MQDLGTIRRALISVSDKSGIADFARFLVARDVEILSTGGTAELLKDEGIAVTEVADYTQFPEMMDGRVKTLHPRVHGGLLGRRPADDDAMREHGIVPIDLLVVNLYPFETVTRQAEISDAECIENIDVGGPAMIRAAAKNHARVTAVVKPEDYVLVEQALEKKQAVPLDLRRRLAAKAYAHTAAYDAAITVWLAKDDKEESEDLILALKRDSGLRYGENPHQKATFYRRKQAAAPALRQICGKDLSFNNLLDIDVAATCVNNFQAPACVITKHANPCGAACAEDVGQAYLQAFAADDVSAFGGIIALNRPLSGELAQTIIDRQFVEVIIAPEADEGVVQVLAEKPSVRVLVGRLNTRTMDIRSVLDGVLIQQTDDLFIAPDDAVIRTNRRPDDNEMRDLAFAWIIVKYVKSNAIVLASKQATVGIGAGQPNRVAAVEIAAARAADLGKKGGLVMASDAFFPFRDSIDAAHRAGVRAVIQPGGSIHDREIVAAADEYDIAMVFTAMRHFRH